MGSEHIENYYNRGFSATVFIEGVGGEKSFTADGHQNSIAPTWLRVYWFL